MANVPAFDKAPAIREIRAPLSRASTVLTSVSAPMANRAVPAAGLPTAAPPMKAVPLADLDDSAVPAAHPVAIDSVPVANAVPMISRALDSFEAVPAN